MKKIVMVFVSTIFIIGCIEMLTLAPKEPASQEIKILNGQIKKLMRKRDIHRYTQGNNSGLISLHNLRNLGQKP